MRQKINVGVKGVIKNQEKVHGLQQIMKAGIHEGKIETPNLAPQIRKRIKKGKLPVNILL